MNVRELQSMQRAGYHPFIVQIFEVHRTVESELLFVFEYMPDGSLHDRLYHRFINRLGSPPDEEISRILRQVLQALDHLHQRGWMHRDVKPENLLFSGDTCKLADFSLARPCSHLEPALGGGGPVTTYIATLWYRAPEIILNAPDYSSPVDLFGLGCVAVEVFCLRPLFPGRNELDQLTLILQMFGTPNRVGWSQGQRLLDNYGVCIRVDQSRGNPRQRLLEWMKGKQKTREPGHLLDLIMGLLHLDPNQRLTASQALQHPYFVKGYAPKSPPSQNAVDIHAIPPDSPRTTSSISTRSTITTTETSTPPQEEQSSSPRSQSRAAITVFSTKKPTTTFHKSRPSDTSTKENIGTAQKQPSQSQKSSPIIQEPSPSLVNPYSKPKLRLTRVV